MLEIFELDKNCFEFLLGEMGNSYFEGIFDSGKKRIFS
jgi:hypothetical protein